MSKDRTKLTTGKSSAQDEPFTSPCAPFAYLELNAIISNQGSPVTNSTDARKWFKNKGWILETEKIDRTELVNILLTVSLLPKIPPEVVSTIRAAAYIFETISPITSLMILQMLSRQKSMLALRPP